MKTLAVVNINEFRGYLHTQERSPATVEKYTHALRRFHAWLPADKGVDKACVIAYKAYLIENCATASVNAELAALNSFFKFQGWEDCRIKPLRIQRRVFAATEKELTRQEYERLVNAAEQQRKHKLSLLLQLMAATGIRVSEIKYITVEAIRHGRAEISLKGKIRVILLPNKLCRKLHKFIRAEKITSGPVFLSQNGKPLGRKTVWAQMKRLCREAEVAPEKVFPHNLRHLFARTFYTAQKDIAKLADLLGHSSVETTRIYLLSSGNEHRRMLERLRLIY